MTVTESLPVVDAVRRGLEIDEQVHEGHRQVRAVLALTTNIARSPAQLWPLLTRPVELALWFGQVTGGLYEGGRFQAPGGVEGRVLQVEEPHRLELTWRQGAGEDPLLLRLDPEDDGTTLLGLRHTTLLDAAEFERSGPAPAALGWEIALLALAAHTDGWRDTCLLPAPTPTAGWLRGPQGAHYVRAWSVRWAAAALAAGVEERIVRRGEIETVRRHLER